MIVASVQIRRDFQAAMDALVSEVRTMGSSLRKGVEIVAADKDAAQTDSVMASQSSPHGQAWAPLSPDYAEWKRKQVGSKKILQFSGEMRKSAIRRGHPNRRVFWTEGVLNLGTNHRLAKIHQEGARGVVYIPAHHRKGRNTYSPGLGITKAGGRHQVRSYAYRQNIPARPFIGKDAKAVAELKESLVPVVVSRLTQTLGKYVGRRGKLLAAAGAGRLARGTRAGARDLARRS